MNEKDRNELQLHVLNSYVQEAERKEFASVTAHSIAIIRNYYAKLLDEVERLTVRNKMIESTALMYKSENETYERSTHINDFLYEINVDDKGEIPILVKVHGIEHSLGITEKDARAFAHLFKCKPWKEITLMSNSIQVEPVKMYRVHTEMDVSGEFESLDQAEKIFERWKDEMMAEGVTENDSFVEIVESVDDFEDYKIVKKVIAAIDHERTELRTPREEGCDWDYWAKWREVTEDISESNTQ
jgi:hypothetical protein